MSTGTMDPTILGLLQAFTGVGQTPQTVINMPGADQVPAVGNPDYMDMGGYGNEIEPLDDVSGVEVERYGSPDTLSEVSVSGDLDPMGAFAQELRAMGAYGNPSDYGSIWSRLTGAAQSATGKTAGLVSEISAKVNKVVGQVNKNSKFLSTLNKRDYKTEGRLRKLEKADRYVRSVISREFGQKGKWYRAALAASHALPGIRALNLFESTQLDDLLKSVIDFGDAVEDMKRNTEDDPYTLTPTSVTPTAPEVAQQVQEIAAAIEDLRRDMIYITDALTAADLKTVGEAFDEAKTASIISQLSKIVPNQITRQEEAIAQSALKYIFGQVGQGGNLLSLNI